MKEEEVDNYQRKTKKYYSLVFTIEIIDAVEKGAFIYKQAQLQYDIQGHSTAPIWLRKQCRLDWNESAVMKKETPNNKIRELEKKLKQL